MNSTRTQLTKSELLKRAGFNTHAIQYTTVGQGINHKIVIKHADDYEASLMSLFLNSHGIVNTKDKLNLILLPSAATKLDEYISKNPDGYHRFFAFFSRISSMIKVSGYFCQEAVTADSVNYYCEDRACLDLVKSHTPEKAAVLVAHPPHLRVSPQFIDALSTEEYEALLSKLRVQAEFLFNRRQYIHKVADFLQPKHQNKSFQFKHNNSQLEVVADNEVILAVSPVLFQLNYNHETNTLALSAFDHPDILDQLTRAIALSQIRLALLRRIYEQFTAISRGKFEFTAVHAQYKPDTPTVAKLVARTLGRLKVPYQITNGIVIFSYPDLFNYVPDTFPDLDVVMMEHTLNYIDEMCASNQRHAEVEQSFEFVLASLIITNKHENFIRYFDKYPRDINALLSFTPMEGVSLLELAITMKTREIVEFLITRKADIASPFSSEKGGGSTPLHAATMLSNVEVVRLLIDRGVNPNESMPTHYLNKVTGKRTKNYYAGQTPVYAAIVMNRVDALHELLRNGAKLMRDRHQSTTEIAINAMANNIVDELIELNLADTSLEQLNILKQQAAATGVRLNNVEQCTNIIASLELLGSNMHATLQYFRKQPLVTGLNECRWANVANYIYLQVPVSDDFSPYVEFYLQQLGIPIITFDSKHLYIPRNWAFKLHEHIQKDLAWKFFTRMIELTMKYFRLQPDLGFAVAHNERLDIILKAAEIPAECLALTELADQPVHASIYYIAMNTLLKLSTKEAAAIIKALETSCLKIESQMAKLQRFVAKLAATCGEKIKFTVSGLTITFDLSARQTATLRPYLDKMCLQLDTIPDVTDEALLHELAIMTRHRFLLDKFISMSAQFGKRTLTYHAASLQLEFQNSDDAKRFREVCALCTATMQCSYADIYALTDEQLQVMLKAPNHETIVAEQKNKLAAFVAAWKPCVNEWQSVDGVLSAELSTSQLPIVKRLKLPGLRLSEQPRPCVSIRLVDLYAQENETLALLASDISLHQQKLKFTVDILCKLREPGAIVYLEDGIELLFKNDECRQHFNACCTVLSEGEACQAMRLVLPYACLFNLPLSAITEARDAITLRIANNKKQAEQEPRVKVASMKRGKAPVAAQTKPVVRPKKKDKATKPPKAEKPQPKSNIPPQRPIDVRVLHQPSLASSSCLFAMPANTDVFDQVVIPRVVLATAPREAEARALGDIDNAHDYVIQYELTFLRSLHDWFAAIDQNSDQWMVCQEILRAGTQLSLIRLMNAIDLRLKANRHVVQISDDEDVKAHELRAALIHDMLTPDDIEALYRALVQDKVDTVFNDALNGIASKRRPSFSKYLTLFKSNHHPIDYNDAAKSLLQRMHLIQSFMRSDACGEFAEAFARRALQACIIQLGELYRHRDNIVCIPHALLRECKELRNTGSHNNTADDELNCDPLEPMVVSNMVDSLLLPSSPRLGGH